MDTIQPQTIEVTQARPTRRIGITGSRKFADWNMVARVVHALPDGVLVHGAASGVDDLCAKWWTRMMGRTDEPHPAEWDRECDSDCTHPKREFAEGTNYCPAAGPRRNQEMVESGLDLLVAFPGGSGTANMIRCAKAAGVPVIDAETGRRI